jgi:hypothetical protein
VWWTQTAQKENPVFQQKLTSITNLIREEIRLCYGFAADPTKSNQHNARIALSLLPLWYYFNRPQQFSAHDLTKNHPPPHNFRSLLGMGFTFCPTPCHTTFDVQPTLSHFAVDEDTIDDEEFNFKLHVKLDWHPPLGDLNEAI